MARASGSGGDEPSDDEMAVMDPYMAMLLVDDEGSTSPVSPKRSKRPRTDAIPAKFQHREHHLMYLNVVAIMMTWRRFLKRSRSSVTGVVAVDRGSRWGDDQWRGHREVGRGRGGGGGGWNRGKGCGRHHGGRSEGHGAYTADGRFIDS